MKQPTEVSRSTPSHVLPMSKLWNVEFVGRKPDQTVSNRKPAANRRRSPGRRDSDR
jgi:hypothetical protein